MEKVIQLKTQLHQAATLAKSKQIGHKRLAAILLDNFIEIQLAALMREKFGWDSYLTFQKKKFPNKLRKKVMNNHDELLKISAKEGLINTQEKGLISFCHEVRNKLYHHGSEEELLIEISLAIMHSIIVTYQPEWKSARGFTAYSEGIIDPYSRPTRGRRHHFGLDQNSEEDWRYFISAYFVIRDKRRKSVQRLLSDYLLEKIADTNRGLEFLNNDGKSFWPWTDDWLLNDYVKYFSFEIINHDRIEEIKEANEDRTERNKLLSELREEHDSNWRNIGRTRLTTLKNKAKEIATVDVYMSFEKFISLRNSLSIIHDSIDKAASDLDYAIQLEIDRMRGK